MLKISNFKLQLFALIAIALTLMPAAAAPNANPPAQRIVAIGGAVTEILYALGQDGKIVGVDTTSLYPPRALKSKPNVGYFRAFSPEGVLSLNPTLIIASDAAGPADAIKLLRQSKVPVEKLPDDFTAAGVVAKIETIGHLTHTEGRAAELAKSVSQGFAGVAALRRRAAGKTRVLFIIAMQGGRPLIAGNGTAADAMIRLAGGVNVGADFAGYKQMNDESIIAAAPDVIVMMANGKQPDKNEIFRLPAFKTVPAAAHQRLVAMDGLYLLGFGPRTPQAARDLFAAFYPDLK
jgi:iron complex transport system substrate-binding protein